jgi:hypothetical protein
MRRENNPILNSKQNGKAKNSGNIKISLLTQPARNEVNGNAMGILAIRMDYTKYTPTYKITA